MFATTAPKRVLKRQHGDKVEGLLRETLHYC